MDAFDLAPPALATLNQKPSWENQSGRVDRSACLELSASEIWRRIPKQKWIPNPTPPKRSAWGRAGEEASVIPAQAGNQSVGCSLETEEKLKTPDSRLKTPLSFLSATAFLTITSHTLFELHRKRLPRKLIGDFRTPKSNAMKTPHDYTRTNNLKATDVRWRALKDFDNPPFPNPNKGASRTKKLALWSGNEQHYQSRGPWQQTLTLQRWEMTRDRSLQSGDWSNESTTTDSGLQTPDYSLPPSFRHFLVCPRCNKKKRKLYMVLATEEEVADAELAEDWISAAISVQHSAVSEEFTAEHAESAEKEESYQRSAVSHLHNNTPSLKAERMGEGRGGGLCHSREGGKPVSPPDSGLQTTDSSLSHLRGNSVSLLTSRYGLLFRNRRLVCGKCLGIRYGEVKRARRCLDEGSTQFTPAEEGRIENMYRLARMLEREYHATQDLHNLATTLGIPPPPF